MSKLTLSVDDRVVSRAKLHAKQSGVSVSEMVEVFLDAIAEASVLMPAIRRFCALCEGLSRKRISKTTKNIWPPNIDETHSVRRQCSARRSAGSQTTCGCQCGRVGRCRNRRRGRTTCGACRDDDSLSRAERYGADQSQEILSVILRVFGIAPVDAAVIQEALQLPFGDFEDAVTAAAARRAGCDHIVTRDPKGFRGSPVRSLTPEVALQILRYV